jgi:hypothetical protein
MQGRALLALLEHVAHAGGADADEHFDEVGPEMLKKGTWASPGWPWRSGSCGAGGADEQDALGDAAAEALELLGVAQEFDDFLDFLAGFVGAGDVLEVILLLSRLSSRARDLPKEKAPRAPLAMLR